MSNTADATPVLSPHTPHRSSLISLSTMWAQQTRFQGNMAAFAAIAREAGYGGIEVSHSTNVEGLEALIAAETLPIPSLHAPTPLMPSRLGRGNSSLNLAATDETERLEAVEHTLRTIEYAGRIGARHMVVHLGGVGARLTDGESRLRRLFAEGRIDSDEARAARADARRQRADAAGPHLDAARRSLAVLVEAAERAGVAIGLENRLHFHEIPNPEETRLLLADYTRQRVGYWHDVGHAEVQARLGLLDARGCLAELAPLLIGSHLHDVRGIIDHRAPGNGDVDWSYIAAALTPSTVRTLEIDQREPEGSLGAALIFLRERGVLA